MSDLQFSSEEELDEVPLNEFEDNKGGLVISAEIPMEGVNADDDSQQAAEAMVQLGSMGYYQQNDEGTDIMYKGSTVKLVSCRDKTELPLQRKVWMWTQIMIRRTS